jgi:N6-L-threonylcarbamoyladenine synthase
MDKLKLAVKETGINKSLSVVVYLLILELEKPKRRRTKKYGWKTYVPKFEYTTDNAAMIGIVGYQNFITTI